MSDIRNIRPSGTAPDKIFKVINGKLTEIKKAYRCIYGKLVVVWDIGDTPEPPAVNEFIITMPATEQDSKYYISLYAMETTDNRHRGTIDWGDGSEEIYWSDAAYGHEYSESGTKTVKIYAPIENLLNSSATGVFYKNVIDYIKFPDSLKVLNRYAFNTCYRIGSVDFNKVEEIMTGAFNLSMMYFPSQPYNQYIDLYMENVKIIRSYIFGSSAISGAGGSAVQSIEISDKIETIEDNAFAGCKNLKTIRIHKPQDSIAGSPWGASSSVNVIWD